MFLCKLRENFLEVKVFFEALSYQLIEQVPAYSVADLQGLYRICWKLDKHYV